MSSSSWPDPVRSSVITGRVQRRVHAPVSAVWRHLVEPGSLLETLPLHDIEIGADRRSGSFTARVGVGRLRISRPGTGVVTVMEEPCVVSFELALSDRSLTSGHTARLTRIGVGETFLDYEVELRLGRPMPRLRRFLAGVFELHVQDYAEHVTTVAERHWRAEQTLGIGLSSRD